MEVKTTSELSELFWIDRSSCPEMFRKKSVLKNFAKFPGKQLSQSLFFNKVATQKVHAYFNKPVAESSIFYRTPVVATSELKAL